MFKKRIFSVILALALVVTSLSAVLSVPAFGDGVTEVVGEWDFSGMGSITYDPNPVGNQKADGSVIVGANQHWYEEIAGIAAGETNGVYKFTSSKATSYVSVYNIGFKLSNPLKKGVKHILTNDLSGKKWPVNFTVYYCSGVEADVASVNANVIPDGAVQLYVKSGGAAHSSLNSIEFTPEADLSAGGYIYIKYKTDSTADNWQQLSNVKLTSYIPDDSVIIKNGSFEEGTVNWTFASNTLDKSTASDGTNSVSLVKWAHLKQTVAVEKGSSYKLSFDVYNTTGTWGFSKICKADGSVLKEIQMQPYGHSGWETVSYEFETGENESLTLDFVADGSNMKLDNVVMEKLVPENAIVKNGSFERGTNFWTFGSNSIDTSSASDGANSVSLVKWAHLKQNITVEKNKSYRICFDVYNTSGTWAFAKVCKTDGSVLKEVQMYPYGHSGWETASYVFQSGENEALTLDFVADGDNMKLDNVIVIETDPDNLAVNGDFTLGNLGWKYNDKFFALSDEGEDGKGISVKEGYHKTLSQNINVEKNTNYKLSFSYKGETPNGIAAFAVSKDDTFNSYSVVAKGNLESKDDWSRAEIVFASGENTLLKLLFQTTDETNYTIDNIRIEKTDEEADVYEDDRAVFTKSVGATYWTPTIVVPLEGANIIKNDDFNTTSSEKVNNATYFKGSAGSIAEGEEASYFGDKALKFEATDTEQAVSIPLKLEENKTYYIGLYSKVGKYDAENGTSFTYGLTDPDSGNFIRPVNINSNAAKVYTDSIQLIPQFDSEWHYNLFQIETNGQTDLCFTVRGKQITAYIDELYVFDPEQSEPFKGTLKKLSNVTVTAEKADKLGIKANGENLFENFDLSETDTYWSDKTVLNNWVFGDTLNIEDSKHNIQENTLLYDNYRMYPRNIYYIKWVDVKPNTEYTFSAKYSITDPGEGYFGILSGYNSGDEICSVSENLVYPTVVARYEFNEDAYDVDQNWQNVGFSFNTGDRNRVGFFVQDGGGTAYIDDLRLFETKNAAVLKETDDNFPNKLVPKNKQLTVSGNTISGIEPETKLSSILKNLKNAEYIRVFGDDGEEITDYSEFAATGMEIRLMNGPVIKARASIMIPGDVVADGKVNKKDSEAIIQYLGRELSLTDYYKDAADYDRDGSVTVYDALFETGKAEKGKGNFILKGPEKFAIGDEIEISLVANVKNAFALSGKLNWGDDTLTFKSAEIAMDGDWTISYVKSSTEVIFAAADLAKKNDTVKDKAVITFTFTVGEVEKYSDIALKLSEMLSATENSLLTSDDFIWPETKTNTSDKNEAPSEDVKNNTENVTDDFYDTSVESGADTESIVSAVGNRLSVLKLDEAEIVPDFDPEIKQYTATVPCEIEKVTVTAIAADENATVSIGDTNLEYIGKNAVDVEVISAEGLKRTYRIIVTREAPTASGDTDTEFPLWAIILIIVGAALLLAAVVFVIIIIIKRKRKKTT